MSENAPLIVEVSRGEMIESRHRVAAVAVDAHGTVLLQSGDAQALVYPRSAIKPLQALVLVESGAADAFRLGNAEIALACASHSGEQRHVELVRNWLERLGLSESDLECGIHSVAGTASPTAAHNNCSGKHAGFLTVARHLGFPPKGYIGAEHPVQQRVMARVAETMGAKLAGAPRGIDGCGIPVFGVKLFELGHGMARFAASSDTASVRIRAAMAAEPLMVAGTGRFTTRAIEATGGEVLIKEGAEGVYCAMVPRRGIGIAVKAEDGAGRAASVAIGHVLRELGALDSAQSARLSDAISPTMRNHAGREIGRIAVR